MLPAEAFENRHLPAETLETLAVQFEREHEFSEADFADRPRFLAIIKAVVARGAADVRKGMPPDAADLTVRAYLKIYAQVPPLRAEMEEEMGIDPALPEYVATVN